MKEARKWISVAREAFHVDMGVMTAKEKSIYRAFIELDDWIGHLEKVIEDMAQQLVREDRAYTADVLREKAKEGK